MLQSTQTMTLSDLSTPSPDQQIEHVEPIGNSFCDVTLEYPDNKWGLLYV